MVLEFWGFVVLVCESVFPYIYPVDEAATHTGIVFPPIPRIRATAVLEFAPRLKSCWGILHPGM